MAPRADTVNFFVVISLWALIKSSPSLGSQSDVDCLRSIMASVEDTLGYLNSSWNFHNITEGSVCSFVGVECWHPDENRVLNIKLGDYGLKGQFPLGIGKCSSLTGLDLSNNSFSGEIPSDISEMMPFVTNLVLSSNSFSGGIPASLANCSYLNTLMLDHNQLSGHIPPELGSLTRLKQFSVAYNQLRGRIPPELGGLNRLSQFSVTNNLLKGPVPEFSKSLTITEDDYIYNPGLCGGPLPACLAAAPNGGSNTKMIAGAASGGLGGVTLAAVVIFVFLRWRVYTKKDGDTEGNSWTKCLKGSKGVKVSMFEKSVPEMKLCDLMKATNNFSKSSIIGMGQMGTAYSAVLRNGTSLMIKRLQDSNHSKGEIVSEMAILGGIKHKNLVPLLGFCVAKPELLLVYEHMPNGTLYDRLHLDEDRRREMRWATRLKIAIGAARGFACLHHNCNPPIIHQNISSKSILLDTDSEPRISDFGLAMLMNPIDPYSNIFIRFEFGDLVYIAPEYLWTAMATPKSDVYSFGVVLLELVTGKSPTCVTKGSEGFNGNLVEWVGWLSNDSKLGDAVDNSLVGNGADNDEIFQTLKIACSCVLATNPKERPTMFEVYQLLRAIGGRYNFSTEIEYPMPNNRSDIGRLEELIVA